MPKFHLFSQFQAEIIGPAVQGTLNVLKSCAKVASIKRVIITSSLASVVLNGKPMTPDVAVDETWFSDPLLCEQGKVCTSANPWVLIYDISLAIYIYLLYLYFFCHITFKILYRF